MNNWKSMGSFMWIHGLPGSGKSVLCSTIIQEVRDVCKTGLATLAFFYFDFRDAAKQDVRSLLSSLLVQLSNRSDKFRTILSELYSAHDRGSQQPSEDTLMTCLKDMLTLPGQGEIYIVVDALDECPNFSGYPTPREQVLMIIQELVDLRLPNLHFCIMSRPEVDIREALEPLVVHTLSLHEQAGQNLDIYDYIRSVVYSDTKMRRWREEDKELVIKTLTEKAGGMFRWVYCQIETLRRCFPASIRRTLDELPETLDGTYEQALRAIDKQKWDYAYRLFQCLVVSQRSLRVEELAELFVIQPNAEAIPTFDAYLRPENPEEFVLSACSTLVVVVNIGGQKIVQFSHFSVREYLISHRIANSGHVSHFRILPRLAHALLARACLTVLLLLHDRIGEDDIRNFPLALYAAEHWVDHAQFQNVSSDIQNEMECLFDKNKPHFVAWIWLYNIDNSFSPFRFSVAAVHPAQPYGVPLYYAALCGFRDIAEHVVDAHPQDVNAVGGKRGTPLRAALDKGHLSVAILLVERGADTGFLDSRSRTPLHIASYRGYVGVVSLLIDRGADLNAEEDTRATPLYLATEEGRQDIARLLLEHSANANLPNACGTTPLHLASERGHDDIVRILLDHGADANHVDSGDWHSPYFPSLEGHGEIFWLLFDHGADANHPENRFSTPLHLASPRGYSNIVQLLLRHGADANRPDNRGLTPLYVASQAGHSDIVQLLLHHGADANLPDNRGWTPLHVTSQEGHNDIVQLLLNRGADTNHRDNRGWTPLHLASLQGHNDIVQLLLDHGANHSDNRGWTPLHLASLRGHNHVVQLLLDLGTDANHPENRGLTPLHLASLKGHIDTVQFLLDHGAVANQLDSDGMTPLRHASREGYDDIAQLLLDHGAVAIYPGNPG
jgi:ankyrin repeat protein